MGARGHSREEWAVVMVRCESRDPGVTIREFAEAEGVSFNAIAYRLYEKGKGRKNRPKSGPGEIRLLPVDVGSPVSIGGADMSSRWLEAETPHGIRLRFMEGTGGEYVADLMSRMTARRV